MSIDPPALSAAGGHARSRRRDERDDFWRNVGSLGSAVDPVTATGEPELWPGGAQDYQQILTEHTGIITTDGLSDPDGAERPIGVGVELYVEGRELRDETVGPEARWLLAALEETAGAVAGAGAGIREALSTHGLLSVEVSGTQAPQDWVAGGRLGVLLGVALPARPSVITTSDGPVAALTVVPLRPSELAVVTAEGASGRRRLAEALAGSGWHSYAESARPAVL